MDTQDIGRQAIWLIVDSLIAFLPAAGVLARLALIADVGEATVLYDRLWTEVKSR